MSQKKHLSQSSVSELPQIANRKQLETFYLIAKGQDYCVADVV